MAGIFFFLLTQTLPTFWLTRTSSLRTLIWGIFGIPRFQIPGLNFPDSEISRLPDSQVTRFPDVQIFRHCRSSCAMHVAGIRRAVCRRHGGAFLLDELSDPNWIPLALQSGMRYVARSACCHRGRTGINVKKCVFQVLQI